MNSKRLLLSVLLLCTIYLPTVSQAADETTLRTLSLEEIVSLKHVSRALLSPNGDAIAYLLTVPRTLYEDDGGKAWVQLHVADLEGNSRAFFSGKVVVSDVAWSIDGNDLYFVSRRDAGAPNPDIFKISLSGGEASVIYEGQNDIQAIHPSPDGATLAFLAQNPPPEKEEELAAKGFKALVYEESIQATKVWILDLDSGEAVAHDLAGSASEFAWAPAGEQYAVALAPTPLVDDDYVSRDIFIVGSKEAEIRNQIGSVGKLGHFAWSPDGERVAYVGSEDINDPSPGRLYVTSSRGGERRDVIPGYPGHVQDFHWVDKDTISWLGGRGLWSEKANASVRTIQPVAEAPKSGPIIRAVDARPGQRLAAAVADTPEHPPEVFLLREGSAPRRLTNSNPFLSERILGKQEVVSFSARDGQELEAVLIHPTSPRAVEGSPLIIFVHGGPEGHYSNGWMSSYSRPAHAMAAQGYTIVYPNYRGSTGRGVLFSKMGQHDYAGPEFNDLVDTKLHLVDAGLVQSERTGISGGSYGGYASMWAASALSEHFAASVAFVGISNQLSKFGTGDIPREMYHVHSRAWPWEDWMWMLERSPVFHAGKTRTPLLIMAGDKDPRVHPSQSLEMYRHVKLRTDTPVRLVFYPGEVHGNRQTAAQYDFALRFERWMNHYLKGPGGAPPPYEIDHAARLED
jgi:dipeptidyl aminopeptidase/acylaminoacyl peptidase